MKLYIPYMPVGSNFIVLIQTGINITHFVRFDSNVSALILQTFFYYVSIMLVFYFNMCFIYLSKNNFRLSNFIIYIYKCSLHINSTDTLSRLGSR